MNISAPLRIPVLALLATLVPFAARVASAQANGGGGAPVGDRRPPNVVVILADDMGYGDLGCFGHPSIRTPNLDRMAGEGQKWTNFYVAAPVCTPSRAALLTGRLPQRSGVTDVLFPNSTGGLPQSEVSIATMLKARGYATACVGKWHLGTRKQFLPTSHGFDHYFGIPYSNDMDRDEKAGFAGRKSFRAPKVEYFNVPLMRDTEVVERPADQTTLTKRYTAEVIDFMRETRDRPFFVYYASPFPHVPLFRSPEFAGHSQGGLYGDAVEELDWSVGEILRSVKDMGLAQDTLVVFTSDNGPWLIFNDQGGSPGMLRQGKGTTWEGGMRVPAILWWPGRIPPQTVINDIGSTLDLLPTIAAITGAKPPGDGRAIDGYDLSPTLGGGGGGAHPRDHLFYYQRSELMAVRLGLFKAHYVTRAQWDAPVERHTTPLLFHLGQDPGEKWDVADQHPDVIAQIDALVQTHKAGMTFGETQK